LRDVGADLLNQSGWDVGQAVRAAGMGGNRLKDLIFAGVLEPGGASGHNVSTTKLLHRGILSVSRRNGRGVDCIGFGRARLYRLGSKRLEEEYPTARRCAVR
jgi:hypothetical protein